MVSPPFPARSEGIPPARAEAPASNRLIEDDAKEVSVRRVVALPRHSVIVRLSRKLSGQGLLVLGTLSVRAFFVRVRRMGPRASVPANHPSLRSPEFPDGGTKVGATVSALNHSPCVGA